ncbi:MAG TPA: exodeoxyribonuclease VII small subunit [Candidatus Poseidoniales archaeon]|nr:MAG TPA: exodeoxyribonuclease VII small subunit [Candidatus Poseidoniales archaeon]
MAGSSARSRTWPWAMASWSTSSTAPWRPPLRTCTGREIMSENPSYSESLQRLEAIVAELERGGTDLEATVQMFEEGTALLKACQSHLDEAEGQLKRLRLNDAEAELEEPEA